MKATFYGATAGEKGPVLLVETADADKAKVTGATWGLTPTNDDTNAALYKVKVGNDEKTLKELIDEANAASKGHRRNAGETQAKALVPTGPLVIVAPMTCADSADRAVSVTVKNIQDQEHPVVKYDSSTQSGDLSKVLTLTLDVAVVTRAY